MNGNDFENSFEVLQIVSKQQQTQFLRDLGDYLKDYPGALDAVADGEISVDEFVDSIPDDILDKYFLSSSLLDILKQSVARSIGLDGLSIPGVDDPESE